MSAIHWVLGSALLLITASASANPYNRIEVCFALDTTGSMSHLIDTAKQKIWFIANEIVHAPSRPTVRFCLLGYRDRGDEYVTRHFDLTPDLDQIHEKLLTFTAGGGGDTPEAVNQALYEVVHHSSWSSADNVLKLVFLVGDAPPHRDYAEPQYPEIAAAAHARGIIINPVLVGDNEQTRTAFSEIANVTDSRITTLAANTVATHVPTPMDQDLVALGPRLAATSIPYGPPTEHARVAATHERVAGLNDSIAADRLSYLAQVDGLVAATDLIEALDANLVQRENLDPQRLPASVRSMTAAELDEHLATVRTERAQLRRLILALVEQRRGYLHARTTRTGFEGEVATLIADQLAQGSAHP